MILYHGTSARHLPSILEAGIKPRGRKASQWKAAPSHPDLVYLTNAYPLHFAHAAAKSGDLLILEVDVSLMSLLPDEDFLEQVTRKQGPAPVGASMKERTRFYRENLYDFQRYALDSLDGIGNAAHIGTIPASSIKRYVRLSPDAGYRLILAGQDPSITVMNYAILSERYKGWVKWMFDGGENPNGRDLDRSGITVITREKEMVS